MRDQVPQEPEDLSIPRLTIRVAAMPSDANAYGDIFGGWLRAQVDIAGSVIAIQAANGRVATIAVNEMLFLQPVSVGDLVSLYARLKRIGNTSISVEVEAYSEQGRQKNRLKKVATATLTYVAVDENGQPRQVEKR